MAEVNKKLVEGVKVLNNKTKKKKRRRRFIDVDVWRSQFGIVSERAIYDIYAQRFNVELHNMKKYSFPHCVNALRKLEDPDYIAPEYSMNRS